MRSIVVGYAIAVVVAIGALPRPADAATTTYTGTVSALTAQAAWTAPGGDTNWVTITGFTSFGTCATSGGSPNLVIMRIAQDSQGRDQFSMLLAAKLAGAQVTVSVDDTHKDGSYCYLKYVKLQ